MSMSTIVITEQSQTFLRKYSLTHYHLVGEGVHALQCNKIILVFLGLACDGSMIN